MSDLGQRRLSSVSIGSMSTSWTRPFPLANRMAGTPRKGGGRRPGERDGMVSRAARSRDRQTCGEPAERSCLCRRNIEAGIDNTAYAQESGAEHAYLGPKMEDRRVVDRSSPARARPAGAGSITRV